IVFARWPSSCHTGIVAVTPFLILAVVFIAESRIDPGMMLGIVLQLLALFGVAMMCHGELAKSRPASEKLTEFYLLVSFGGVLGGVFNAVVAPLIFPTAIEH